MATLADQYSPQAGMAVSSSPNSMQPTPQDAGINNNNVDQGAGVGAEKSVASEAAPVVNKGVEAMKQLLGLASHEGNKAAEAIPVEENFKMYIKPLSAENKALQQQTNVGSILRNHYNDQLSDISSKGSQLNDFQNKLAQALENKVPLTKMAETPSPDQGAYSKIFNDFKKQFGIQD